MRRIAFLAVTTVFFFLALLGMILAVASANVIYIVLAGIFLGLAGFAFGVALENALNSDDW